MFFVFFFRLEGNGIQKEKNKTKTKDCIRPIGQNKQKSNHWNQRGKKNQDGLHVPPFFLIRRLQKDRTDIYVGHYLCMPSRPVSGPPSPICLSLLSRCADLTTSFMT